MKALLLLLACAAAVQSQTFMSSSLGRRLLQANTSMTATNAISNGKAPAPSPASAPFAPIEPVGNACQETVYISSATTPMAIYDQLTPEEYMDVAAYLVNTQGFFFAYPLNQTSVMEAKDSQPGYNESLPNGGAPTLEDNAIYNIFLAPPNKTEALAYLDQNGPKPQRYASVIVVRGAEDVPDVMEYKVGPIPTGPQTTVQMIYEPGEISWLKRPSSDAAERTAMEPLLGEINAALTPLFFAIVDQCLDQNDTRCDGNNISQWSEPAYIREVDGNSRVKIFWHWLTPVNGGAADELFAIPVYFKLNVTSMDPDDWYAFDVEHCTQGFESVEALMEAFEDGSLKICSAKEWASPGYNAVWSDDVTQGPGRNGSPKPGPRLYEPEGKRFYLLQGDSPTSRVFEWMGWEGHVTANPWTGLQFHNIKFKGERIIYELAVQDQFVAYSGYQSIGQSYYYDATYQLGGEEYTLRPGIDCPETAAFMDVTVMGEYGVVMHFKGGICIFEDSMSTTSWRHFDANYGDGANNARDRGVRQTELVFRTIATVGNYDYMYDVRYQLDGEVRVTVFMAGYMQNTYFDPQHNLTSHDARFGTRTQSKALSNIHDHLTSWKVDFDIVGTSNSFHRTVLLAGNYDDIFGPGSIPSYASEDHVVKYATDTLVETEAGYKLKFEEPQIFLITNDNATNDWGLSRSYGIFHQYSAPQLLPDSHPLVKGASWTKYNIAVTQRKESEQTSSKDYYDAHLTAFPITGLDHFLDNETIVDQDLVAWVSMGILHVPRAEDVPLISNIGSEFQLKPINYFNALASLDVTDNLDFKACAPRHGSGQFDYTWNAEGNNYQYMKNAFTVNSANVSAMGSVAAAG